MRFRARLFVAVASSSALALVACVSSTPDDTAAPVTDGGTTTDTSFVTDTGPVEAAPPTPVANASDVTAFVGTLVQLDASASTPTTDTFSWAITNTPAGSAITIASVQNANTAKPSFTPDVVGDYKLTLTVSSGGLSGNKVVTVHAVPGSIFYMSNTVVDGGTQTDVHFAKADGTGAAAITCEQLDLFPSLDNEQGNLAIFFASSIDWHEGDAGDAPRAAFPFADHLSDAGVMTYLGVGTSGSSCAGTAINKLDPLFNPPAIGGFPRMARFSPSGNRIAYLRDAGQGLVVSTIGFDGSNPRALGNELAVTDAAASTSVATTARWSSETQVDWILQNSTSTWSLLTANDADVSTTTVLMTCNGPPPSEFDLLSDGSIITAASTFADGGIAASGGNLTDLVVLQSVSGVCQQVRNLTNFSAGSSAQDFSLSPDKTKVAFVGAPVIDGGSQASLMIVPVDGSSAPVLVTTELDGGALVGSGPRWIGGGAAIVWGQTGASLGSASNDNVVAVSAKGGALQAISVGTDAGTFYAAGNVQRPLCSVGRIGGSTDTTFGFAASIFGVGLVVARRRKRNAK